jgi:ribokinase
VRAVHPRLTVIGSINLDLVARVERLPRPGETLTGASLERIPGGKGANQAVAAARMGAGVTLVGAVGTDAFADEALGGIEQEGVRLSIDRREATGTALILVDATGDNQIVVVPGANASVAPMTTDEPVLCQLEIPIETVEAAAQGEGPFFLNAAPAKPIPSTLVQGCDLVIVNRYELDALPAQPRLTALTLGEEGAVLLEDGREIARARPPRVDAVDGTAAGDAFTGCLVVSILEGRDHEEALQRACVAGAIAASRFGARPSLPTAAEVDAMLAAA